MQGDLARGRGGIDYRGRPVTDWEGEWHRRLADVYGRAARRPWLPVAPDPDREAFREEYRARRIRRFLAGSPAITLVKPPPGGRPIPDAIPDVEPLPGAIRIVPDPTRHVARPGAAGSPAAGGAGPADPPRER